MANRECSIQRTQNNLDTRTGSGYIKNLKKGKMHHKQIMDLQCSWAWQNDTCEFKPVQLYINKMCDSHE